MKRFSGFALRCLAVFGLVGVGALVGRWSLLRQEREVIAAVNGEPIVRGQLQRQLRQFELRSLELLCFETLVRQEANRQHLKTEGMNSEDLATRVALAGVSEFYLRRVYASFPDLFRRYDLEVCLASADEAAEILKHTQANKMGSFLEAARKWGQPVAVGAGWSFAGLTRSDLEAAFGGEVADGVVATGAGQVTPALPYRDKVLVVRVATVHDSFEELRPEVERMVGESRKLLMVNSLLAQASISSTLNKLSPVTRQPDEVEVVSTPGDYGLARPESRKGEIPTLPPLEIR